MPLDSYVDVGWPKSVRDYHYQPPAPAPTVSGLAWHIVQHSSDKVYYPCVEIWLRDSGRQLSSTETFGLRRISCYWKGGEVASKSPGTFLTNPLRKGNCAYSLRYMSKIQIGTPPTDNVWSSCSCVTSNDDLDMGRCSRWMVFLSAYLQAKLKRVPASQNSQRGFGLHSPETHLSHNQ